jgi:Fe(3+) dicitrate transport protein
VNRNVKFGNYLVPLEFSYTYTNSEFLSNFESKFGPWGSVQKGDELPYLPKHQIFTEIGLLSQKANLFFRLKNISAMRTKAGSGTLLNEYSTDDLTQIDITSEYRLNNKSDLFLTIKNLTDSKSIVARRPAGLRPTLPRTFSAGIKFNF